MAASAADFAFDEVEGRTVIKDVWARFQGQPVATGTPLTRNATDRSGNTNGLFGLVQKRRWHLFQMPQADPQLPGEMGAYPAYQSDVVRQTHRELVSRLVENPARIVVSATKDGDKARSVADRAEWLLTYGTTQLQERTGRDWQRALAEGASAYCYGILHWTLASMLPGDDYRYVDAVPKGEAKDWQAAADAVGGDKAKGKYRERPSVLRQRNQRKWAERGLPFHVEVCAADSVAFVEDESPDPGKAMVVYIKEVGIVDYNRKLADEGRRLAMAGDGKEMRLALEEFDPKAEVGVERPAPAAGMPSASGYPSRILLGALWTRTEYYEYASPVSSTAGGAVVMNEADWVLVKRLHHPFGQPPFAFAYATVEENESDPALKYRPACDGLYNQKPFYDYSRALEMRIATQYAVKTYFIEQAPGSVPMLEGDEEGDDLALSRDSNMARTLPPGQKLAAVETGDLSPAFIRSRELQGEELRAAAPATGTAPIEATTQPWTANFMLAASNAYPAMLLRNIARAEAEMIRNWVRVAALPLDEGGLGMGMYVAGYSSDKAGTKNVDRTKVVGVEPDEWDGLWVDVVIDSTTSAMRNTQIQVDLALLNNPTKVMTPEMFVSDSLGVQDATGYMQEVDAYWALRPMLQGLMTQELAKTFGKRVVVGADGTFVGSQGQAMGSKDVLAMNGVRPGGGPPGGNPMGQMPSLPALQGSDAAGVPPVAGVQA